MKKSSAAPMVRPEVEPGVTSDEIQPSFYDRGLDGVRSFLEEHAMTGKTGARAHDFYDFEKALPAPLIEAERGSWAA